MFNKNYDVLVNHNPVWDFYVDYMLGLVAPANNIRAAANALFDFVCFHTELNKEKDKIVVIYNCNVYGKSVNVEFVQGGEPVTILRLQNK